MTDEESRRAGTLRLDLLRSVERAMQRYPEVLGAIAAADDRAAAEAAVQQLLGIDRHQAVAVLALRWDRLTREEFARITDEIARQEAALR